MLEDHGLPFAITSFDYTDGPRRGPRQRATSYDEIWFNDNNFQNLDHPPNPWAYKTWWRSK